MTEEAILLFTSLFLTQLPEDVFRGPKRCVRGRDSAVNGGVEENLLDLFP
jgi:hypothetical protein